jgi:ribosome-associated protein
VHVAATERAIDWTIRAALAAAEKKAGDIVAIDVSEKLAITDIFLILTGSNDRQVKAIADAVEEALDRIDVDPVRREGTQQGRWILLDYIDIVVHIQHEEERAFYDLERLWKDCPYIALPLEQPVAP